MTGAPPGKIDLMKYEEMDRTEEQITYGALFCRHLFSGWGEEEGPHIYPQLCWAELKEEYIENGSAEAKPAKDFFSGRSSSRK